MGLLDSKMAEINKELGSNIVHWGIRENDYERIPFTSPRLNYITFGGLPKGKLIEFYGEKGGGKTTTALDIVANYQHMSNSKSVLYIDAENTLDMVWASKLGVDVDDMLLMTPEEQGAETIFKHASTLMTTGELGLVVIDSIGVLMSNRELEGTTEEKHFGGISMALTDFSKRAVGICNKTGCTLVGINQERDVINSPYGAKKVTGGNAWQYNVCVRLCFNKGYYFDEKYTKLPGNVENPFGNRVEVSMTKNKTCAPTRKTGFYTLRYDIGIDYFYDLTEVCLKYGVIEKSGSWFSLNDITTGEQLKKLQGQAAVSKFFADAENAGVLKMYEDYLEQKIKES